MMICRCGLMDVLLAREAQKIVVTLSGGTAIARSVGETVRVEHLDCGACLGIRPQLLRTEDCGCLGRDYSPELTPDRANSGPTSSGSCACGVMHWESAPGGALIFEGAGTFAVWDEDGQMGVVDGRCLSCGVIRPTAKVDSGR